MVRVSLFSVKDFLIYKFKLFPFLKRLYSMSSTTYIYDLSHCDVTDDTDLTY